MKETKLDGLNFAAGVAHSSVAEGEMLLGHAHGEPVLLTRSGNELFAIGAFCTHYGAPLNEGLLVGDTLRCPWHHACFSLRTGEALRAPALNPISCWRVEQLDGTVYVREKLENQGRQPSLIEASLQGPIIILGGGAAGNAAAEMLRREGYVGRITMLSADESEPYDRPNLSKGYLAGTTPEAFNLLRSPDFYKEHDIDLKLGARATTIDIGNRYVQLESGSRFTYAALLLATGAEPVRLEVPGGDLPHVYYLRTLADSRALIAKALVSQRAVVIGASFIGLEVAASLRNRGIEVHVVGRETSPMEKVLGADVGNFIRKLHEEHGVTFHLDTTATSIDAHSITLQNGEIIQADFIVVGIGVRPSIKLAEQAGLAIDRGVTVNEYLETSVPGIFAAGDIARWPDRLTGEPSASNTGLLLSVRGRLRRAICLDSGNVLTLFRSSGPSSTISASLMSATLSGGTKPRSTDSLTLIRETARSHIAVAPKNWQWLPFTEIWSACARKSISKEVSPRRGE